MPSAGRESTGCIASPLPLMERFAITRTTVPHSASGSVAQRAIATSRLPLSVIQRPSIESAATAPA